MAVTSGHRRGFFFTIMAFAILSFMLLTAQVWVRTFEQSDQRASVRFKGEAVRLVLSTISDKSISEFANASAFYATYRLATFTSEYGNGLKLKESSDPKNAQTGMVEETVYRLMENGTSADQFSTRAITYSSDQMERYTVSSWQGKIRSAANMMGFNVSFSNMTNFSIRQEDAWTVRVSFDMQMNISDLERTMYQGKTLHANTTFSVHGFIDPSITRGDMQFRNKVRNLSAEKQIFKHLNYTTPSDVAPVKIDERGFQGSGWFYGPITREYPDEINESQLGKLSQYVLVADPGNNKTAQYADFYGAIILTERPVMEYRTESSGGCTYEVRKETKCLNCIETWVSNQSECLPHTELLNEGRTTRPIFVLGPQITAEGLDSIPMVIRDGVPAPENKQQFVLIDNEKQLPEEKNQGEHYLWDITKLRDMSICGFYLESDKAPSFFQRMLANPYTIPHSTLGIESFVLGQWAGGAEDDPQHDSLSRIDWEYYGPAISSVPDKIKGMPGCKSREMCSGSNVNATKEGIGKFRLSTESIARYSVQAISCSHYSGTCE